MSRLGTLLLLLLLVSSAYAEKTKKSFWKLESERSGAATVATYKAVSGPAKGQGILMCALWPEEKTPVADLVPSVIMGSLYRDLKDFQLLGQKPVTWGGQPARLISFKAVVSKKPVVGRALLANSPGGTEALMLVANQASEKDFNKEFTRLQTHWEFSRPASANVLQ